MLFLAEGSHPCAIQPVLARQEPGGGPVGGGQQGTQGTEAGHLQEHQVRTTNGVSLWLFLVRTTARSSQIEYKKTRLFIYIIKRKTFY